MNQDEPTRAPIDSRGNFHDAVRGAFAEAALVGCREILLIDDDFADWPISEREVIDDLTHWVQAHRAPPCALGDLAPPVRPCGALPHQQRSRSGTDAHHPARAGPAFGASVRPGALPWHRVARDRRRGPVAGSD